MGGGGGSGGGSGRGSGGGSGGDGMKKKWEVQNRVVNVQSACVQETNNFLH